MRFSHTSQAYTLKLTKVTLRAASHRAIAHGLRSISSRVVNLHLLAHQLTVQASAHTKGHRIMNDESCGTCKWTAAPALARWLVSWLCASYMDDPDFAWWFAAIWKVVRRELQHHYAEVSNELPCFMTFRAPMIHLTIYLVVCLQHYSPRTHIRCNLIVM